MKNSKIFIWAIALAVTFSLGFAITELAYKYIGDTNSQVAIEQVASAPASAPEALQSPAPTATPEQAKAPQTQVVPETPAVLETPATPETPVIQAMPEIPETPEASASPTVSTADASELTEVIKAQIGDLSSSWDVWIEKLDGDTFVIHESQNLASSSMVSASLIKLFVMGAVFDATDKGSLSYDTVYYDLLSMISISDNAATNRLIRLLGDGSSDAGMEAVNNFCASIGCNDSHLYRLLGDEAPADTSIQNYVSVEDCATILRMIYNNQCISADYSAKMLELLKTQTVDYMLPAGLPSATVMAHKTGSLSGLCWGDVGIAYLPDGAYIIGAICNYPYTDSGAIAKISEIASAFYTSIN